MKDGKFLLGKRTDNNKWTSPGGHINNGESPEQATVRETQEEVQTTPINIYKLGNEQNGDCVIYACEDITIKPTDSLELTKVQWFDREQLNQLDLYEPFKQTLVDYYNFNEHKNAILDANDITVETNRDISYYINKIKNQNTSYFTFYKGQDDPFVNKLIEEIKKNFNEVNIQKRVKRRSGGIIGHSPVMTPSGKSKAIKGDTTYYIELEIINYDRIKK